MPVYDVVDEGEIDADHRVVFRALLAEFLGASSWWMPHLELKLRGDEWIVKKGSIIDVTVHLPFGGWKFAERVVEIVEDRLLKVEYFEGDFLGTGEWILEPYDGKTRVKYYWRAKSTRFLITLLSPFVNIAKYHSKIIQLGFKGLNSHVTQRSP